MATEQITFADFQKRFQAKEPCREYLYRQSFPKGFVCPKCERDGVLSHLSPESVPV